MEDPLQESNDVWIFREILFLTKFSQKSLQDQLRYKERNKKQFLQIHVVR